MIIFTYQISKKEDRGIITAFISLFGLIGFEMFVYIPSIQLLVFACIMILALYVTITYILPKLFFFTEMNIFAESKPEVWENMKLNSTVIERENKEK